MPEPPRVTDLTAAADRWSAQSEDLRTTLIVLSPGQALAAHVNHEVDLVLVTVAGRGRVDLDGTGHRLAPGGLIHVPRGSRRELTAEPEEGLRVLVVHRRTAVSGPWRWKPRRRRPWEDPWEEIEAASQDD